MNHTPGKWEAHLDRDYAPNDELGDLITVDVLKSEVTPSGYPVIAELINSPFDEDEILANARLIAAAPALLEALEQLLEAWEGYEIIAARDRRLGVKAKGAIAQAKGDPK